VELYSAGFVCRVERMEQRLGVVAEIGLREGLSRAADWYLALNA
jgi:nucleoside-diphosphate-sugar epimerase